MQQADDDQRLLIKLCLEEGVWFVWRGPGSLMIHRERLELVLDDLRAKGIDVIGMEAFELERSAVRPRFDLIFDAARLPNVSPQEISSHWPTDVWVDLTLAPWRPTP